MSTVKESFPATGTSITLTLNSLASSGTVGRASSSVDNSTNLDLDALVNVAIAFPNSAPANDLSIYVFAYGSYDGTAFPEGVTGSDASFTLQGSAGALKTALRLIGVIPAVQNVTANYGPFPVAPAFGGILPPKWGLIVLNVGGQTLSGSGNSASYSRVQATVA
jgi:hypothetical protein